MKNEKKTRLSRYGRILDNGRYYKAVSMLPFFKKKAEKAGEEPLDGLVSHAGNYSGAFILFGGWMKVYDHTIPAGTRGHELYCAMGGVGASGWKGDCLIQIASPPAWIMGPDGSRNTFPKYWYKADGSTGQYKEGDSSTAPSWKEAQTGWKWFLDKVKSFMYLSAEQFMAPCPIIAMYNSSSDHIGSVIPKAALSAAIGGGTVKVKS